MSINCYEMLGSYYVDIFHFSASLFVLCLNDFQNLAYVLQQVSISSWHMHIKHTFMYL